MKHVFIILLSIGAMSCMHRNEDLDYMTKFEKIYSVGFKADYSYVNNNPDSSQVLIFSSMFANGLKYVIVKHNYKELSTNILFEKSGSYVPFAWTDSRRYCIIEENFDSNTLKTSLLLSQDYGQTWQTLLTPIEFPRSCYLIKGNSIIVEGNLDGTGQIFLSINSGKNWNRIIYENKYKTADILSLIDSNHILCKVSKTFDDNISTLAILNLKNKTFKELIDLENAKFILPISEDKKLYSLYGDGEIVFFKVTNLEYDKVASLSLPENMDIVDDIYCNKNIIIITGSSYEVGDKSKSWINLVKSESWRPFFHDRKLKLVYNNSGTILVEDGNNDVFRCELTQ